MKTNERTNGKDERETKQNKTEDENTTQTPVINYTNWQHFNKLTGAANKKKSQAATLRYNNSHNE